MMFAWYVIHDIKNTKNKPHLASYHGKFGAAVIVALVALTLGSIPFFEPDWRLRGPTADRIRTALKQPHKWGGRIWLIVAVGVLISGFVKKIDEGIIIWAWGVAVVVVVIFTLRTGLTQIFSGGRGKTI
jgi:hypothetical protein